jgi:hypothetical protein
LQGLAGGSYQRAGPDQNRRFGVKKNLIAVFAIAADRCHADSHLRGRRLREQVIKRDSFAGIFGHAHHRQRAHAAGVDTMPEWAFL